MYIWVAWRNGGVIAQWREQTPSKATIVSLSKNHYAHCLGLVGSRDGFKLKFISKQSSNIAQNGAFTKRMFLIY